MQELKYHIGQNSSEKKKVWSERNQEIAWMSGGMNSPVNIYSFTATFVVYYLDFFPTLFSTTYKEGQHSSVLNMSHKKGRGPHKPKI